MDHPTESIQLFWQIRSQECKSLMSEEEIHFDQSILEMEVLL